MSDEIKYLGEEGLDTLIDETKKEFDKRTKTIPLEEFIALSDEEKNNGTYYHVVGDDGVIIPVVPLTKAEYDALGNVTLNDNVLYIITDMDYALDADNIKYGDETVSDAIRAIVQSLSNKVDQSTYNSGISGKANSSDVSNLKTLVNRFVSDNGRIPAYTGNLNDITTSSIVNCLGNANAPDTNWGFCITLVWANSTSYAAQIWIGMDMENMYYRIRTGGWHRWYEIHTDASIILE